VRGREQEVRAIPSVTSIEQSIGLPLIIIEAVSNPRSLSTSLGVN
jgi:hypothetical protein